MTAVELLKKASCVLEPESIVKPQPRTKIRPETAKPKKLRQPVAFPGVGGRAEGMVLQARASQGPPDFGLEVGF